MAFCPLNQNEATNWLTRLRLWSSDASLHVHAVENGFEGSGYDNRQEKCQQEIPRLTPLRTV